MKVILVFVLSVSVVGLSLVGCGGNPCIDACNKIKNCDIAYILGVPTTGECNGENCTGNSECVAGCTLAATCDELKNLTISNLETTDFGKCFIDACGQ